MLNYLYKSIQEVIILKNRRLNNKRKVVFLGIFAFITIFMSIGYSYLSEQLKLEATANLYASKNYLWYKLINDFSPSDLIETQYETGKYAFIGNVPNNYIQLDGDLWRIISIESDHTIKVIKNNGITTKFDDSNNRTSASTYCQDLENGCNNWDLAGNITNNQITGSVENASTLSNYLNTTFYNSLNDDLKLKIAPHIFNTGAISNDSVLTSIIASEQANFWEGNIGLPSISDFLYSESGNMTTTLGTVGNSYLFDFINQNFLWTINPLYNDSSKVWVITNNKSQEAKYANTESEEISSVTYTYTAHPTMFLNSTVKYSSGTGTLSDPFILE